MKTLTDKLADTLREAYTFIPYNGNQDQAENEALRKRIRAALAEYDAAPEREASKAAFTWGGRNPYAGATTAERMHYEDATQELGACIMHALGCDALPSAERDVSRYDGIPEMLRGMLSGKDFRIFANGVYGFIAYCETMCRAAMFASAYEAGRQFHYLARDARRVVQEGASQ